MNWPTRSELLFSTKSFAAAMLALYIALRIGLPRPFWSMLTAYVVANPLSGAVRSKAVYRIGGTFLGSIATVLLVPGLSNAPELLSLAMALWVAACLYISLLDRTPRSYVFMLAGYTAALIGFPAVSEPAQIFDIAVARVEEITLGILCATAVHSLVFPRSVGPLILTCLDQAIADARQWMQDALRAQANGDAVKDRRKLAADITELRLMSTHLPFDTSHLRWTANAIRALQDRLSALVPMLSAVEDRVRVLRDAEGGKLSPVWQALLQDVQAWIAQDEHAARRDAAHAARIRLQVAALTPTLDGTASWKTVLQVNLAERLPALIDAWEECLNLRRRIDGGFHGRAPSRELSTPLSSRVLHRDRGLALLSSLAAAVAILSCCAFWIYTAWPAGSAAAMMAAVFCCFFATQDDPVPGIMLFLKFTLLSIPVSALYLLVILPAIHSFEMLVLVTAPLFLLLGVYVARPATSAKAMAFLFGVGGTLSLQDTGSADLVSFINGMLGQLAGIGAAVLFTRLLRSVNADWTARRLLRAGWSELAALGQAVRVPPITEMSARMLDRIALLTPRLALAGAQQEHVALDVLADLRVGLNMTQLQAVSKSGQAAVPALPPLMDALATHYRQRSQQAAAPGLLNRLDDALQEASVQGAYDMVAALVGIRRDLFPGAVAYRSTASSIKEHA